MPPRVLSDYQVFHPWELEACKATEKRFNKRTAGEEAEAAWILKTNRQTYTDAVRRVQESLKKARSSDKKIYSIPKKFSKKGKTRAEAYRTRWRTLTNARKEWVAVRANLFILDSKQGERDDNGSMIVNDRTFQYTGKVIMGAAVMISQLEKDLEECCERREEEQAPVRRESEYLEVDSNEDEADGNSDDDRLTSPDYESLSFAKSGITLGLRRHKNISDKKLKDGAVRGLETLSGPEPNLKSLSPRKRKNDEEDGPSILTDRAGIAGKDRRSPRRRHNIFGRISGEDEDVCEGAKGAKAAIKETDIHKFLF